MKTITVVSGMRKAKFDGNHSIYTLEEADLQGLRYTWTPFTGINQMPRAGNWIVTKDRKVVQALSRSEHGKHYLTPFGYVMFDEYPTVPPITINDDLYGKKKDERRHFASWMARVGDFEVAFRFTFGRIPKGKDWDILNNDWTQYFMAKEFDKLLDENGIPSTVILQERVNQMKLLTALMNRLHDDLSDESGFSSEKFELFLEAFKAQGSNLQDLEDRYVKKDDEPDEIDAYSHYRLRSYNKAQMPKVTRPEDEVNLPSTPGQTDSEQLENSDNNEPAEEQTNSEQMEDSDDNESTE